MTKQERVISAIQHKDTGFVPHNIEFTKQEYDKMAVYLGDSNFLKDIGNHISSTFYDGYLTEKNPGSGYWEDDFGVIWNRNCADKDIGVVVDYQINETSLEGYAFPKLDESRVRADFNTLAQKGDGTFKIAGIGFSMFERAWTLRGMENILMDMLTEPEFVESFFDAITEYNMKVIDIALEYSNIDAVHFGDDWGQQAGLIMGPRCWKRFIKPRMARMFERVKRKGKFVSLHSCGDIHEVFPDLIEIGLDVYQTFQPEIYDLNRIKKEYGKHLTFWGGISTQRLLPFAAPAEVKRVIKDTIRVLGRDGGYIAAPTHVLPGDIPPENVMAMIEAFKNQ